MVRPEDTAFARWRSAGDADALGDVYDLCAPSLLRLALHHVRHPAAAEDLVQATFVAAIENAAGYDAARPLLGWLVGILHNQAKWLQRREGRAVDASRLEQRAAPDPLASAQGAELSARCDEAIEVLPEVYRPVLRLSLRHDLSAAEIAHALGRPAGTVRSQLTRGLELLRAALPAGTALAAFAVLAPGRGLAAVRELVLAAGHAQAAAGAASATAATATAATATVASAAPATSTAAVAAVRMPAAANVLLTAGLTMKKTALALTAVAALLLLGTWIASAGSPASGLDGQPPPAAAVTASASRLPPHADDAAETQRVAVATTTALGWRLSGTVLDRGLQPVVGASVEVVVDYGHEHEAFATVTTAADGGYVVDLGALRAQPPLDRERAALRTIFRAPGHVAHGTVTLPHRDPLRALDVVADARLLPAAVVLGRVVGPTGRPVSGATVSLRSQAAVAATAAGDPIATATTGADGRYVLSTPTLEASSATGFVVAAAHVAFGRASLPCVVELARDELLADLVLRSDPGLRGLVVFGDGTPAVGVDVNVYEPDDEGQTVANVETGPDGSFAVCTLPAGTYRVRPRCHWGEAPVALTTTGDEPFTLVLAGLHQVRFAFADEHGAALRPMDMGYERWDAAHGAGAAAFAAGGERTAELEQHQGSAAGWIRSVLVDSGTWLYVEASQGAARGETVVQVLPPRNVHDVTLTLRELRPTATLRLQLACSDGRAPGDVELRLHQLRLGEPGSYELPIERDGDALVARWSPGRYRLEVRPKQRMNDFGAFARFECAVHLRDGETTVVAETVHPGGRVRLHLRPPDAQARGNVEGLAVETPAAAGDQARRRFVQELADGWIVLGQTPANTPLVWMPLLPPGRHVLTFRSRDFADTTLSVDVEPRAVTDLHVWLQPR